MELTAASLQYSTGPEQAAARTVTAAAVGAVVGATRRTCSVGWPGPACWRGCGRARGDTACSPGRNEAWTNAAGSSWSSPGTMGAVGYRLRSFSFFAAIAAVSWGVYSGLVGYLGGWAFENDPLKGLLLGLGLALAVTTIVECTRHHRRNAAAMPPATIGGGLTGAIAAEWTKFWSVRSTWWCVLDGVVLMGLLSAQLSSGVYDNTNENAADDPGVTVVSDIAVSSIMMVQFVAIALAMLMITSEYVQASGRRRLGRPGPRRGLRFLNARDA